MTYTDYLSDAQLDAITALDVNLADDTSIQADREHRRLQAERRQSLIVDYLFAAEEADAAPRNRARAKALDTARRSLAAFLVGAGEYPTVEAAALAADSRQVYAMPKPGVDYSKVVPF